MITPAILQLALTQPALAQQLGGAAPVSVPVVQILAGLVLCALMAFALALIIKRRNGSGPVSFAKLRTILTAGHAQKGIQVLETRRISLHADVCRFAANGREYLVIVSQGGATILQDIATAPSIESSASEKSS